MATQGPLPFGTIADDATVGTVAWTTPTNAAASDNSWTTAGLNSGDVTHYLKVTNAGFSIVGIPTSVVLSIERNGTGAAQDVQDSTVKLVVGGSVTGPNKAVAVNWPTTTDAVATYTWTIPTDLALTQAQVNASTFGAVLSATVITAVGSTARVDYLSMTVTYTPPLSGGSLILQAGRLLAACVAPVLPRFAAWLRGEQTQTRRLRLA